ncbi:MAG: CpaF family protein [Alphaproteobacteria bacterium]|nr:CpaF family protein [Alphaproteobacteria bacterium]
MAEMDARGGAIARVFGRRQGKTSPASDRDWPVASHAHLGQVVTAPSHDNVVEMRPAWAVETRPSGSKSVGAKPLVRALKREIKMDLMDRLDLSKVSTLSRDQFRPQLSGLVTEILAERSRPCSKAEQEELVTLLLDEMVGLGPLEPLLKDESVSDIMVNGAHKVYVERNGKTELTDVTFDDDADVINLAIRIATRAGRRIDESSPLVDARLEDGSRVNIIIPPLALDGPAISIRKFSRNALSLGAMQGLGSLSEQMVDILQIAGKTRLNILVTGGTGSGKTSLLNAISAFINPGERVVTVEDAAELRLLQPHVVRLETRPPSLDGGGEIRTRDLVRNALRMRPDRIIVGEVRGDEVIDMLQAMNTGHDGSLGTLHANTPRDALTRLENLVALAGFNAPPRNLRQQIVNALDLIVHTSRMRDGVRRVTHITEIIGMEGDTIITQDLFAFDYDENNGEGRVKGRFTCSGLRPRFAPKVRQYGLERELYAALHATPDLVAA